MMSVMRASGMCVLLAVAIGGGGWGCGEAQPPTRDPGPMDPVQVGRATSRAKGCNACHTLDGSASIGPTLRDVYGSMRPLTDGRTVLADERYVQRAILDHGAELVEGYPNVGPTMTGQITQEELDGLLALLRAISEHEAPELEPRGDSGNGSEEEMIEYELAEAGAHWHRALGCRGCHSIDGSPNQGPTHFRLFGSERTLSDGRVVVADEAYIRRSILTPWDDIVAGFHRIMPDYGERVTTEQVDALVAFLRTIGANDEEESVGSP